MSGVCILERTLQRTTDLSCILLLRLLSVVRYQVLHSFLSVTCTPPVKRLLWARERQRHLRRLVEDERPIGLRGFGLAGAEAGEEDAYFVEDY